MKTFLGGEFDGDFHKVINLKIGGKLEFSENIYGYVGFFTVTSGTIKNLSLIMDTELNIGSVDKYSNVGLLVGQIGEKITDTDIKKGSVQNCSTEGNIKVNISGYGFNLGGVVGSAYGEVENCCNKVDLELNSSANGSSEYRLGGICGAVEANVGIMKNCYNVGNMSINHTGYGGLVGGLCGRLGNNGYNLSNYNLGNISDISDDYKGTVWVGGCYGRKGTNVESDDNFYTLDNLVKAKDTEHEMKDGYGEILNTSELSGQAGVNLLNGTQEDKPWTYDEDINNGFPILKWQLTNNEND